MTDGQAIPVTPAPRPAYRRIMLKLSGEALMGPGQYGLHPPTVGRIADEVKALHDIGVEISLVIGGGNIFRGLQGSAQGMERTTADYMGMLATVMNALAMQSALESRGIYTRVLSAIPMAQVCEPYIRRRAVRHLEKGRVVIFAAGTGNPISPPTPRRPCAPARWAARRSSRARRSTASMTAIRRRTRMPSGMTG